MINLTALHNQRFFSYLSLFTFMMIILVTANNFLLMFVGWEGVGICSYLLVNFWFTRIAANQSSISAFLTNRVGDCFLTIGIFAILWSFGNIDYSTVFSLAPYISENIVTIIGICLLIGAMAKSSQVGLHVWLPMAMEGPTPVSALIHAATMVTAGVYLLIRTSPLIEYSSTVLTLCLWVGAITTIFSSLIGLFQQDIKKVIAYSTMSQLAPECKSHLITFSHQTIYEKIINLINIIKYFPFVYKIYLFLIKNQYSYSYIRNISSLTSNKQDMNTIQSISKLNPYYITGFVDGEGCFLINIVKRSDQILGFNVNLVFKLKLHSRDIELLKSIRNTLGQIGNITIRKDSYVEFIVSSKKDIEILIKHFESYPLLAQKWSDYQLFKQTFILIKNKEHLKMEGLNKIVSLKSVLNNGLSDNLKIAFPFPFPFPFPDIITEIRPKAPKPIIKDSHWISGFVDGEGCFFVALTNNLTSASLIFKVTQHVRDADLLKELINYFNCGYYKACTNNAGDFIVTKFNDINSIIIPFFNKYPILGSKLRDYLDFVRVAELIQKKAFLTTGTGGLEKIKQIKSSMNKGRSQMYKNYNTIKTIMLTSQKNNLFFNYYWKQPLNTKCIYSQKYYSQNSFPEKLFNEWLAGLIDACGQLLISKKGYANFKLIVPEKDKSLLFDIKHKYGGSIKSISGSNAFKYKLHHKKGLISLVNDINGLIRNPNKILQLNKICRLYNIKLKPNKSLIFNNGWFSGFIDGDGSIFIDEKSNQLIISIAQKNRYLLDPLIRLYSGRIEILPSKDAFLYKIYRKKEVLNLVENYFNNYTLRSNKAYKIKMIKDFYLYKDYKNSDIINEYNLWIYFKNKWNKQ